jgi:hypothetical protein
VVNALGQEDDDKHPDCVAHLRRLQGTNNKQAESAATSNTVIKTGFSSAMRAVNARAIILRRSAEFLIRLRVQAMVWAV